MSKNYISPNFTHEKLEKASFIDLVDVFEDRMQNWLLGPMRHLLSIHNGEVAAIALAMNYFEGIEIYRSGKASKDHSKEFFRRGFQNVFTVQEEGVQLFDELVNSLYAQARCGFAHDGLFRNRMFFSSIPSQPVLITWPKANGVFNTKGHVESIVINPALFCESIEIHFSRYVNVLRVDSNMELAKNFEAAVRLTWGLEDSDRVIGISESEFHSTKPSN
jgi:hypothetical protein